MTDDEFKERVLDQVADEFEHLAERVDRMGERIIEGLQENHRQIALLQDQVRSFRQEFSLTPVPQGIIKQ